MTMFEVAMPKYITMEPYSAPDICHCNRGVQEENPTQVA